MQPILSSSFSIASCANSAVQCQFDDLAVDDWETMVDVNIKGVLFGIAAALPVFRKQGFGHSSTQLLQQLARLCRTKSCIQPPRPQYSSFPMGCAKNWQGKFASVPFCQALVTQLFSEHVKSPEVKAQLQKAAEKFAMSPDAVARAVAYVIEQPEDINVGEITLRSRAQP